MILALFFSAYKERKQTP